MAEPRLRDIRESEVQGLKCLRKIAPLLSRLRRVGTQRGTAGNRKLFMDRYYAPSLLYLFSPAISSLRELQRASTLDTVRRRLGVGRASLGSLSELVTVFNPEPLNAIAAEAGHQISGKAVSRLQGVGQRIAAVDGTVIERVKRVAELSWTPLSGGKRLSAYRLHAHFEVLTGKPVRMDATPAKPRGEADEQAVLARALENDRRSVVDRGYTEFALWNAINDKASSCIAGVPDSTAGKVERTNELGDADRRAGVIRDQNVVLGGSPMLARRPDHPVRLIQVEVKAHESHRGMQGPRCDGTLRIATNRPEWRAELSADIYRQRWLIEMFFRLFKQLLGCRHLISDKHKGVEIQAYCGMIACLLILLYTAQKPNKAMFQMAYFYIVGPASLKELEAFVVSRR